MPTRLPSDFQARLTGNIQRILALKRLNAEHIHRNSDMDKGNLSRYFNGHRDYTLLSLVRIAGVLEVDVSELFKPPKPKKPKG